MTNASTQSGFGETLAAGVGNTFTVAAANVALTATTSGLKPSTLGVKPLSYTFTVTVTDRGNENASGTLTVSSESFNDANPVGSLPTATYQFPAHIKIGKSQRFVVHGRYSGAGSIPVGTYNLQLTLALEGATVQVSTTAPFTVT